MPRLAWRVVLVGSCLSLSCETFEALGGESDAGGDAAEASPDAARSEGGGPRFACTARPERTFPSLDACRAAMTSSVGCDALDAGVETGDPCGGPRILCSCQGGGSVEIALLVRDCACR
ncbi:MAG: hypothetical protein HOO96_21685 [Polyangiaceae bacterium]|nr:hypothetical protein [Polyangiaceae bacterium]